MNIWTCFLAKFSCPVFVSQSKEEPTLEVPAAPLAEVEPPAEPAVEIQQSVEVEAPAVEIVEPVAAPVVEAPVELSPEKVVRLLDC